MIDKAIFDKSWLSSGQSQDSGKMAPHIEAQGANQLSPISNNEIIFNYVLWEKDHANESQALLASYKVMAFGKAR